MSASPVQYHLGNFPPQNIAWPKLIPLIGPATASLARYDGLLSAIPNAHILLSPLTTQEAVLSSKIEGTRVTMGEVLEIEAEGGDSDLGEPKIAEAKEVLNYRTALRACMAEMQERSLSQHVLRAAHAILMKGVRGGDKTPGQYRIEQNWIGRAGSKIEQASFIPISPAHLQSGMDEWERYLRSTTEADVLVQLAVIHAEFEALHPFKDGNGRIGRILIPLFLAERKLLTAPDFYMSGYLEAHRDEYIEHLREVSRSGNWTDWCAFFLRGILEQADENERKARAILALYDRVQPQIAELTRSHQAHRAVEFIFETPIFTASTFTNNSDIPKPTAARILKIMREKGVVRALKEGKGRRAGVYAFRELLNIAEGRDVL